MKSLCIFECARKKRRKLVKVLEKNKEKYYTNRVLEEKAHKKETKLIHTDYVDSM